MTRTRAIIWTIIGIFAAWLIIRGIIYWESSHPTDAGGSALVCRRHRSSRIVLKTTDRAHRQTMRPVCLSFKCKPQLFQRFFLDTRYIAAALL